MNKSDYTVNKVKFFRGHDGDGFNTNLLCNGKVVATVDDDGWGGGYNFDWIGERTIERTNEHGMFKVTPEQNDFLDMLDSLPLDFTSEYFPEGMKLNGDCFIEPLVTRFDNMRKMKRALNSKIHFKIVGEEGIRFMKSMKYPNERGQKYITEKYPKAIILNALPLEQAIELYFD